MLVNLAHFSSNIHHIVIVGIFIFTGKVSVVDSCNPRASERGVTSFLDLFDGSSSSETIRRQAKECQQRFRR